MRPLAFPILASLALVGCTQTSATFGGSYDECVLKSATPGGNVTDEICQRHFIHEPNEREIANVSSEVKLIETPDPSAEAAAHAITDAAASKPRGETDLSTDALGRPMARNYDFTDTSAAHAPEELDAIPIGAPGNEIPPAPKVAPPMPVETDGQKYQKRIVIARQMGMPEADSDKSIQEDWTAASKAGMPDKDIAISMGYNPANAQDQATIAKVRAFVAHQIVRDLALEARGRAFQARVAAARNAGATWDQIAVAEKAKRQDLLKAGLSEAQIARAMGYPDIETARASMGFGVPSLQISGTNNNRDTIIKEIDIPVTFRTTKGTTDLKWTFKVDVAPGGNAVLTGEFDGPAPSEHFTARAIPQLVVQRTGKGG